jgi:hypothetical protein
MPFSCYAPNEIEKFASSLTQVFVYSYMDTGVCPI